MIASSRPPALWLVLAAFASVYIFWGATYFFIRWAIETIPPLLMAGSRFLLAGLILYALAPKDPRGTTRRQWRDAAIVGALLLLIGNGGVAWAETRVSSSLTALLVAVIPLWMMLLAWAQTRGPRPRLNIITGLLAGFAGVAVIASSRDAQGHALVDRVGVIVLLISSLMWACGSMFSRRAQHPSSALQYIAMQMICGGALQLLAGLAGGEGRAFDPAAISLKSWIGFGYLLVFGSLFGFTAYAWLLQVSTPARVSTYAYINPLLAVLLGSTLGREPLSASIVGGGALIICAVILIVTPREHRPTPLPIGPLPASR